MWVVAKDVGLAGVQLRRLVQPGTEVGGQQAPHREALEGGGPGAVAGGTQARPKDVGLVAARSAGVRGGVRGL